MVALVAVGQAQTYSYSTPGGSVDTASDKVAANVLFTVHNGSLDIDLTNLLATLVGSPGTELEFAL